MGKLKAGETLVVSGAAGAVGSLVCQLGKKAGAKVYAIAGSQEKCEWLEKELGVDKAFNYKSASFAKEFKSIGYLDVFFDNVGGDILDMALTRLNKGARVVLCGTWFLLQGRTTGSDMRIFEGAISQYSELHALRPKIGLTRIHRCATAEGHQCLP